MRLEHLNNFYSENEIIEVVNQYCKESFSDKKSRYFAMKDLIKNLPLDKKNILDYGCGTGLVSKYISDINETVNVDAVDIGENEIKKAKLAFGDSKINFINFKDFDFAQERYDLIISTQVIEHVHNPGMYLNRIAKMLKGGGDVAN